MKKYLEGFLSLIYPNTCFGCECALVENEEKLCLRCYRDLPVTDHHKVESNPMLQMFTDILKVKGAFCYLKFNRDGIAQKLLHELKYKDNVGMGLTLGRWFGRYISGELESAQVDYIIPLPLHRKKLQKRGFNQSEVLARGMEETTEIPVLTNVLIRSKNIQSQTKKGKVERWQNTTNIYEVVDEDKIRNKNVLLLDDVITTGATIGSALEVLSLTETKQIYFGCIASGK